MPPGPAQRLPRRGDPARSPAARPKLSTTGGTSDARFIQAYCPVAEFGLVGQTMHKVDERVELADLAQLTAIYEAFLASFSASLNRRRAFEPA